MIYTLKSPLKMGIYYNSAKKTISAIQKELGATVICNLNLFDLAKFTGDCFTKANGVVVGNDGVNYPVLAWNSMDGKMTRTYANSTADFTHAFGCLDLVKNGKFCSGNAVGWASGKRQRTAIGVKPNNDIVVYCNQASVSAQSVANELITQGCDYAIMVDGGASTQCIFPNGKLTASRIVHTLFYAIEDNKQTKTSTSIPLKKKVKTTALFLNVRKGAGTNYGIAKVVPKGTVYEVQGEINNWYHVVDGYISKNYTTVIEEASAQPTNNIAKTVQIMASALNIRSGIGTSYPIVGVLPNGAKVVVYEEKNGWYKTDKGWISKVYTKDVNTANSSKISNNKQEKLTKMMEFAKSQLGCIYCFGAQGHLATDTNFINWSNKTYPSYTTTTRANRMKKYAANNPTLPNGLPLKMYDCSGFVLCAIEAMGVKVTDTTAAGIYNTLCTPIKKSELQAGDIVFTANLDHVGLVGEDGVIYAAEGSDIGVVQTANVDYRICKSIYYPDYGTGQYYQKSAWVKFGRLKCLEE